MKKKNENEAYKQALHNALKEQGDRIRERNQADNGKPLKQSDIAFTQENKNEYDPNKSFYIERKY